MNRFPKMAYLQYQRALALNYPVWQAKAIGMAEAKKYAMFKNRRSYIPKGTKKEINKLQGKMFWILYTKKTEFLIFT